MNFKNMAALSTRSEVRRWLLCPEDFRPFILQDVVFNNVDPARRDLYYLDCASMPRVHLDQLEDHVDGLWAAIKWANKQAYASLSNCFTTGENVPVYNSKKLALPTDGGRYKLKITVQGLHCDTRRGLKYCPILIMEEVVSGRQPSIRAGSKQIQLPGPADEDEDVDEDVEEDEDEEEPPVKRQRVCNTPDLSDAELEAAHAQPAGEEEEEDEDRQRAEWINNFLEAVQSPVQQHVEPPPHAVVQAASPPAPHPQLLTSTSKRIWLKAIRQSRMMYFQCPTHGGYLCPDCFVHVADWKDFARDHYGCSCFGEFSKEVVCDFSCGDN